MNKQYRFVFGNVLTAACAKKGGVTRY